MFRRVEDNSNKQKLFNIICFVWGCIRTRFGAFMLSKNSLQAIIGVLRNEQKPVLLSCTSTFAVLANRELSEVKVKK